MTSVLARLAPSCLLIALPSCVGAHAPPTAVAAPSVVASVVASVAASAALPGTVTYEVRSWGRLLLHWQVNPDGTGEIWRGKPGKGEGGLRKFRMRLEGNALQQFATNVEDARQATKAGIPCDKEIFDLPYGAITWDYPGAKQVYAFDAGCTSQEGEAVFQILGAASTIVETMARVDAKPYMIEPAPR
jgi:hypothetical protein